MATERPRDPIQLAHQIFLGLAHAASRPFWVLVLLAIQHCFATSIIVVWTPQQATIGADAKLTNMDGDELGRSCKIGRAHDVLFAVAGIAGFPNGKSFYPLIAEILQGPGTFDKRISTLEATLAEILTMIFNRLDLKPTFVRRIQEGDANKDSLRMVIVFYENRTCRLLTRDFTPKLDGSTVVVETSGHNCPGDSECGPASPPLIVALGVNEEVNVEVRKNPAIRRMAPTKMIQLLIDLEIKAHPDQVGPPISAAFVDESGTKWLTEGACGNSKEHSLTP